MIKIKNQGELLVNFDVPGVQVATAGKRVFVVPFACQLKALYLKLGTAGTTGNQDVDINKNGTSIISSANKIRFASGAQDPTAASLTFSTDPTVFAKGDIITLDVDALNTTPAANLACLLVLQRLRGTGPVGATIIDGLGLDSE